MHMLTCFCCKNEDAVWNFIQGINWLQPTITSISTFYKNSHLNNVQLEKSSLWIYRRLLKINIQSLINLLYLYAHINHNYLYGFK